MDGSKAEKGGIPVEEVRTRSEAQIPVARYGQLDEFAGVAASLASGANTYITGRALLVEGMVWALQPIRRSDGHG